MRNEPNSFPGAYHRPPDSNARRNLGSGADVMNGEAKPGKQAGYGPTVDPAGSVFSRYPAGSDIEVIAALRHFLEETGRRPEELDESVGLLPGAVALLAAGYLEPSGPLLRRLCHQLRIPRWLFHLIGSIVAGAEVGHRDLEELVEKRRRQLAGNPDQITDADLTVEAVEILLALGEDSGGAGVSGRGSRRGLVDGLKRLARRAERLGEHGIARLLDGIVEVIEWGAEDIAISDFCLPTTRELQAE